MELVEGLWHRVRMLHVGREHVRNIFPTYLLWWANYWTLVPKAIQL